MAGALGVTGDAGEVALSKQDLREVTGFAAACAEAVLGVFEADRPGDTRPREALVAAWAFAGGGERGKLLRDTAWAALKAAKSADTPAASEAARAAMAAAGAAYLHPLAKATQVKHILGAGPTRPGRPSSPPVTIRAGPMNWSGRRCAGRHRPSWTCSNAFRRHRPAGDAWAN
ncbi:putative immunity protein [Streptomyces aureus]